MNREEEYERDMLEQEWDDDIPYEDDETLDPAFVSWKDVNEMFYKNM